MEKHALEHPQSESSIAVAFAPRLIIESEAAHRVFLQNLADVLFPHLVTGHAHAADWPEFWPDVFVTRRVPWWAFVQSLTLHLLFLAALWSASRLWLLQPQILPRVVFSKHDVIYFSASDYLPPLDTGSKILAKTQKGEPQYSRQTIISVPSEADNPTQTVVAPPNVKLRNEVVLPNVVKWNTVTPAAPLIAAPRLNVPHQETNVIAPAPTIEQAGDRRRLPTHPEGLVAPPPEVLELRSRRAEGASQTAIIEPPPAVENQIRHFGDINVGQSEIVAPAPELTLHEQRTIAHGPGAIFADSGAVVAPPPSLGGTAVSRLASRAGAHAMSAVPPPPSVQGAAGPENRIVALGLHPVAGAPPVAAGNRRGSFASTPTGSVGALGTPEIKSAAHNGSAAAGSGARTDLPSGLLVRPGPASSNRAEGTSAGANSSTLVAEARPPLRVAPGRRAMASTSEPTAEERAVFGERKFYSMMLNMPNLNSAGGSWVIRFAELKENAEAGDLTAPEALRKVDPAYPLELMRTQIEGKVILYAVIHSDGSVGDVRVLSSIDERLDEYARAALSHWRFRPAMKAGTAVALEAVVSIPFRSRPAF
jgi:TonB family protein